MQWGNKVSSDTSSSSGTLLPQANKSLARSEYFNPNPESIYARSEPGADQRAARPDARRAGLCAAHDLFTDLERRHAAVLRGDRRCLRIRSECRAADRQRTLSADRHRVTDRGLF